VPLDQTGEILLSVEDTLTYDDQAPWATEADGYGHSLHRRGVGLWGDDAASWFSAWPTPGVSGLAAGDADRNGRFDPSDIVLVLQGGKYLSGEAADWEEGDFNGDGVFDQLDIVAALRTGDYLQTPQPVNSLVWLGQMAKRGGAREAEGDLVNELVSPGAMTDFR
jgi:hypothetical protein